MKSKTKKSEGRLIAKRNALLHEIFFYLSCEPTKESHSIKQTTKEATSFTPTKCRTFVIQTWKQSHTHIIIIYIH